MKKRVVKVDLFWDFYSYIVDNAGGALEEVAAPFEVREFE